MRPSLEFASLLALLLSLTPLTKAEVYSSIEQLAQVGDFVSRIGTIIDKSIELEEQKLSKLRQLQEEFSHEVSASFQDRSDAIQLKHPIGIFLTLDRFLDKVKTLDIFVDDVKESTQQFELLRELETLKANDTFPNIFDLNGAARGIARLQAFYNLDIDRIVEGRIREVDDDGSLEPKMDATSCFKLGRILYHEDDKNSKSMSWFKKAIELFQNDHGLDLSDLLESKLISDFDPDSISNLDDDAKVKLSDMLEYLAFSSYLAGKLRYASEVTRIWLALSPENPRAIENFDWYQDQLKNQTDSGIIEDEEDTPISAPDKPAFWQHFSYSPVNYSVTDDTVTKKLCIGQIQDPSVGGICYIVQLSEHPFLAGLKVEIVRSKPKIIRFHDIVTENEANHIRSQALNNLTRSSVQGKKGGVFSDYRIAKTAWLKGPKIATIERRLSSILGLSTRASEALQVVNYGLGGYYGPHLDSLNIPSENVTHFKSDRLMTALIYLNHIEVGGATAFPRIGLAVEPIARSAVVWYNKLRNGTNDPLALHTACPVLLGSKWIATKWFRDLPNTFLWPCKIDRMGD